MKRVIFLVFVVIILLSGVSYGFKEAFLNKGLEVGFGYVYSGVGFELGYETKLSGDIDLYPWLVFGGIGRDLGIGFQVDLPIKVFKEDLFTIAVGPFLGTDWFFNTNRVWFNFDLGGYGLFSFDFRTRNVPLSFSFGFGPNLSFSANPGFGIFYTVNMSLYLGNVVLQVGGNSKFAGFAMKITSASF
ncbi:MAG: hypothetical protein ACP5PT_03760 [Brevinematia bacterium]